MHLLPLQLYSYNKSGVRTIDSIADSVGYDQATSALFVSLVCLANLITAPFAG